jgi:hypothetical protein
MAFRDREMLADFLERYRCGRFQPFWPKAYLAQLRGNRHGKGPACAAASSSSGLVPTPFSNRVPNEYCTPCREVLSVNNEALPLLTSPRQTAVALPSISRPFQSDRAFYGI